MGAGSVGRGGTGGAGGVEEGCHGSGDVSAAGRVLRRITGGVGGWRVSTGEDGGLDAVGSGGGWRRGHGSTGSTGRSRGRWRRWEARAEGRSGAGVALDGRCSSTWWLVLEDSGHSRQGNWVHGQGVSEAWRHVLHSGDEHLDVLGKSVELIQGTIRLHHILDFQGHLSHSLSLFGDEFPPLWLKDLPVDAHLVCGGPGGLAGVVGVVGGWVLRDVVDGGGSEVGMDPGQDWILGSVAAVDGGVVGGD